MQISIQLCQIAILHLGKFRIYLVMSLKVGGKNGSSLNESILPTSNSEVIIQFTVDVHWGQWANPLNRAACSVVPAFWHFRPSWDRDSFQECKLVSSPKIHRVLSLGLTLPTHVFLCRAKDFQSLISYYADMILSVVVLWHGLLSMIKVRLVGPMFLKSTVDKRLSFATPLTTH